MDELIDGRDVSLASLQTGSIPWEDVAHGCIESAVVKACETEGVPRGAAGCNSVSQKAFLRPTERG